MSKINGSFKEQLDASTIKKIEELYADTSSDTEFELMFFNYKTEQNTMSLESFLKILEYLNYKAASQKLKLVKTTSLDVNYTKKPGETYRVTISSIEAVNRYIKMLHIRKNHVIFSVLVGLLDTDESLSLIKKTKDRENIHDIDDFDIRVRLASEVKVSKKELDELQNLTDAAIKNINFRFKQRISVQLEENLNIDLTNIKMTNNINFLGKAVPSYELEIDLSTKKDKKYLDTIFKETNILLKIIQQSNYLTSRSLENEVLGNYAKLLNVQKEEMLSLAGRKAQSLEVQHVVDQLPNKYAVTDKADGERCFLMIYNNHVFLISDLLRVKNTGIQVKKYNNSILDGELIFIKSMNKYLFMAFDCLYSNGHDVRGTANFLERLGHADDVINNCFGKEPIKEYKGKFDMNALLKYHQENIKKYFDELNKDLEKEKFLVVRRKYFIPAQGGQNNEIFKYTKLMWEKYTQDDSVKCPYILDGMIYHPLDQKYALGKESKFVEYKWKPDEKNSIDFYVTYERNRDTREIVTLYDNSREEDEQLHNKPYRVLNLHVGKSFRDIEKPVLFEPEKDSVKHVAYIFLEDGEARDLDGNIIQDETVVEFYYNNDPNIPDKHRWVPMRTRYDKTELVQRYGKKYGNNVEISYKIWRSIKNPISINDFDILSKDDLYNKQIDIMRGKIDHSVILSEAKENVYFQKITNLAKPMRSFHNWLKSNLLYTYVNAGYQGGQKKTNVLDVAVGRGADLMKMYYGGLLNMFVGLDIDINALISPVDGAISRYNQFKRQKANFPRMYFIQADGGVLFNYEDQNKALGGMNQMNKKLTEQFFSSDSNKRTKFGRISCQFAIHYFFKYETTWNNFTQNIKDYLEPNGYFICTTFDADRIIEALGDKDKYTVSFTDDKGEKNIFFDIEKKYEGIKLGDDIGLGQGINFYNSMISQEGNYNMEYLVQKKFIVKELLEKCDLELVDTDLFENQYILHEDFFTNNIYKSESKEETRKFLSQTAEFYNQKSEVNIAGYKLMRLYRYYVFRRKGTVSKEVKKEVKKVNKKKQKGGEKELDKDKDVPFNEMPKVFSPTKYMKKGYDNIIGYSFLASVHDILKNDGIIPKSVSMMKFYTDIGYDVCVDNDINEKTIKGLSNKMMVRHEFDNQSTEIALEKPNFMIVSRDCDKDEPKLEKYNFNKEGRTMVLYHDGNKFWPIYKVKKSGIIGLHEKIEV